jgi:hypothetical protein
MISSLLHCAALKRIRLSAKCMVLLMAMALRLSAQNMAIYTDSLQNSWNNWSWGSTLNFSYNSNTQYVHSGSSSISVTMTSGYAGLYLEHADFSSAPYAYLTFWVNGGPSGGQPLDVDATLGGTGVGDLYNFTPTANTWQQIIVPLSTLGAANAANFDGFWIQSQSGSALPVFYVDDISLTTNTNSLPAITLTSPTNGAVFTAPASINLAATVTTNGHTITGVQFYNGTTLLGEATTPPYSYTWSGVSNGNYSVMATLIYDSGASLNSAVANITVGAVGGPPGNFTLHIAVDQFGYMPNMAKVAVISNPQVGYNTGETYTPGSTLQVCTWSNNTVVYSGSPVAWNNGATHTQSGDIVWWFDFSPVTLWGEYYIYDPANNARSARFQINQNVYENVLMQAARMYYYQRRGTDKPATYAGALWTDGTNFMGPLQDSQCQLNGSPSSANQKDLRGGWFDAGNYDKYVTWTDTLFSDLLFAYRQNPLIWPDNWNIPESGNGIPDLLDEIKWELDWFLRMQNSDGSVLTRTFQSSYATPPSAETCQIFYGAASTTASYSAAGSFAQAVRVYQSVGMTAYANTLSNAAVAAYNWAVANPSVIFSGAPEVDTSNYAYWRDNLRMRAAVFLYEITGQSAYSSYVESNYASRDCITTGWWGPYESSVQDALLYYTTLPGITPSVASTISNSLRSSASGGDFYGAWTSSEDAYRAYMPDAQYDWGCNEVKSHTGLILANQVTYGLNPSQSTGYLEAAAGYVHYMHGVNPLTKVYLSNMYGYGVENCANEIWHSWFANGTIYSDALTSPNGPAPGYLTGGADMDFAPDSSYTGPLLSPPMGQPPQKSYKDWNIGWPQDSWQITEPDICYQASYLFLLSRLVHPLSYQDWTTGYGLTGASTNLTANPAGDGIPNLIKYAFNLSPLVNDQSSLPQFSLQSWTVGQQTGTYLTVQFLRQLGQTNLTYVLEGSPDLVNWSPLCTAAGTNSPSGPGFISETGTSYQRQDIARDTVAVETATTPRFVRFKLIWN